jgi:hypothetical protein
MERNKAIIGIEKRGQITYDGNDYKFKLLSRFVSGAGPNSFYYVNKYLEESKHGQDIIDAVTLSAMKAINYDTALEAIMAIRDLPIYWDDIKEILHKDVDTPNIINEEYDQTVNFGTNGNRESTFIKDEYRDIVYASVIMKILLPIVNNTSEILLGSLTQADTFMFLYKNIKPLFAESFNKKLATYLEIILSKTQGNRQSRLASIGVTVFEINDYIESVIVIVRLSLMTFKGVVDNAATINTIKKTIEDIAKKGEASSPVFDVIPRSGDDQRVESLLSLATSISIPINIITALEVYLEKDFIDDLNIEYDRALYEHLLAQPPTPINSGYYIMELIFSGIMETRLLKKVDKKYHTKLIASMITVLIAKRLPILAFLASSIESDLSLGVRYSLPETTDDSIIAYTSLLEFFVANIRKPNFAKTKWVSDELANIGYSGSIINVKHEVLSLLKEI